MFMFDPGPAGEVVAIDCETTGLNVRSDDIITIAAIKIRGNRILASERLEMVVRPDAALQTEAIKVHRQREIDVADGAMIWKVLPRFLHFVGGRPLVGYYIDFDIAMLDKYVLPLIGIELPNSTRSQFRDRKVYPEEYAELIRAVEPIQFSGGWEHVLRPASFPRLPSSEDMWLAMEDLWVQRAVLLAIPLGTLAALRQDTWVDYVVRVFAIAGLATPSFWLGIVMFLVLLAVFRWIPPMVFTPLWDNPWQNLSQMIWPALAVGYRFSAVAMRMTRSAMLEVLREDYIRTARAKGLWQRLIIERHALKNALLPVLTVIALEFAFLMGGLVVTEQVFNLNGLGLLFVQSVARRDYTLVQALVLLVACVYIVVNFGVDLLYGWLDPRIRYQ